MFPLINVLCFSLFQFYSKRFACEYCEAAYNSEYMLNLHMKQHETDTLCDEQQDTEDTQVCHGIPSM